MGGTELNSVLPAAPILADARTYNNYFAVGLFAGKKYVAIKPLIATTIC